jgi:hypothetical protein
LRLVCTGERLQKWFSSREFKVLERDGDRYLMEESPPSVLKKGQIKSLSMALYAIVQRFEDYAERHPDPELQDLVAILGGQATYQALVTIGELGKKQTAKAKMNRNSVTTEEIVTFRDSYPKTKNGTPKKGWIKAAVSHFEKRGKSINRDTIAARLKAIAE